MKPKTPKTPADLVGFEIGIVAELPALVHAPGRDGTKAATLTIRSGGGDGEILIGIDGETYAVCADDLCHCIQTAVDWGC